MGGGRLTQVRGLQPLSFLDGAVEEPEVGKCSLLPAAGAQHLHDFFPQGSNIFRVRGELQHSLGQKVRSRVDGHDGEEQLNIGGGIV